MHEAGDSSLHSVDQPGVAPKYLRAARVVFPDGILRHFRVHKNAEGQVLFDLATDYVLLAPSAKGYLALVYHDRKQQPRFVKSDVAIGKQIAAKYWNFALSFKFYVTEPAQLSDGLCRHYMLHQCRRDVYLGRIPTDFSTQARLAGYVAQMELGDFQQTANYTNYYANVMSSERSNDEEFVAAVREFHESLSGQTPQQAELDFLNCCKELPLYGCHRVLTKSGKHTSPTEVAIGAPGLFTYKEGQGITNAYPWQAIEKISISRKFLYIKFLQDLPEQPALMDGQTVFFKLENSSVAERFYKLVLEHHAFFRLVKSKAACPPKPKSKGFFQWASRRFLKKSLHSSQPQMQIPDNDQTVMTVRVEETAYYDDESVMNFSSELDRTQLSESEDEGTAYHVGTNEINHALEMTRAFLESTKLDADTTVDYTESEV